MTTNQQAKTSTETLKVQLLLTGDEIMAGDIVDSNSAVIAQQLKNLGLAIHRKVTVGDNLDILVDEIRQISAHADILIINGGLGPTVDDLTAQALAQAANITLEQHPQAMVHLHHWSKQIGIELNAPNLKQAMLPAGCNILANPVGSAVGFSLTMNQCTIFCTPGVPRELKRMLDDEIMPQLKQQLPAQQLAHTSRLQVFGYGESNLQKLIDQQFSDWPAEIELGFRASMPMLEVKLSSQNADHMQLKQHWLDKLTGLLGDHLVHQIDDKPLSLAQIVCQLLSQRQLKLTTAESCTGGLIASQVTQIAGASQVFEAGFVTYANHIKAKLLKIPVQTMVEHGAVSKQTVIAMAKGALASSEADITIAVSGIAGPDGGTTEKPIGTVWLAWGDKQQINSQCLLIPGSRKQFQQRVAAIALDLVRRHLIDSLETPNYVIERGKN